LIAGSRYLLLVATLMATLAFSAPDRLEWPQEQAAASAPDFGTLARTFRDLARKVLAQAPEHERPRARLRLATSALLLAQERHLESTPDAIRLVEQACSLLRDVNIAGGEGAPANYADVERLWHRTAVALLEGWLDDGVALETHLRHALGRFSDDPHLRLARGFASENQLPLVRTGDVSAQSLSFFGSVEAALGRFKAAQEYEAVHVEATLHLGVVLLKLNRPKDALEELDEAARLATDVYLQYLAQLFRGQALEALDRIDEAVEAYRLATTAVPGAQTAAVGLTLALIRTGQSEEAAEVAAAATRQSSVSDPFLTYGAGNYRSWRVLMDQLLEAAR